MRPGEHNAITDVEGIEVGHHTRDEGGWLTGVTVVTGPPGTTAGVDVRGGGPGTRETDILDPRNLVNANDAIVLTGGSAFGLGTVDGVMRGVYADGRGWAMGTEEQRVPMVSGAVLFDLGRGGSWLHHPSADDGQRAYEARSTGPVEQGCVGAGTGAVCGGLKGGIGTASVVLDSGFTIGAIVAVNAVGSAIAPDGTLLGASLGLGDEFAGLPQPAQERVTEHVARNRAEIEELLSQVGKATTIGIIATDAALDKAWCSKLAGIAHDGFARALNPVHTAFDGDTVFTLATHKRPITGPLDILDVQTAVADVMSRAIVHAVLAATSVDRSADEGLVAMSWRDLAALPPGPAPTEDPDSPEPGDAAGPDAAGPAQALTE